MAMFPKPRIPKSAYRRLEDLSSHDHEALEGAAHLYVPAPEARYCIHVKRKRFPGRGQPLGLQKWVKFVRKYRRAHPEKSWTQCLRDASPLYQRKKRERGNDEREHKNSETEVEEEEEKSEPELPPPPPTRRRRKSKRIASQSEIRFAQGEDEDEPEEEPEPPRKRRRGR